MVRINQLNLQHNKAASYNFAAQLSKIRTHIALIQEPWVLNGKILGKPNNSNLYALEGPNNRPRAGIYTSKNIRAWSLSQYTSNDVAAIMTNGLNRLWSGNICFCSVYMAYDLEIPQEFINLVSHCETNNIPMIIGCDANAHHTSWGSSDINNRGEKLLEYLMGTNLIWVNKGNRPTFINKRRGEVIDLTLVSLDIAYIIDNWQVSDSPTLSDHALIQFHVRDEIPVESYRNVRNTDWDLYMDSIATKLNTITVPNLITSTDELDSFANCLTDIITDSYHVACPLKQRNLPTNKRVWWTKELERLRIEVRRAHRKAMRHKSEDNWLNFKILQKNFKSEIRKTKTNSWRNFCSNIQSLHETARIHKILKKSSDSQLSSVQLPDGSFTSNPQDTLSAMLNFHLGGCDGESHGGHYSAHNSMDLELAESIVSFDKCKSALDDFLPFKSPGNDGIFPVLLQKGWDVLGNFLVRIYISSLTLGYVPKVWRTARGVFLPKCGKDSYCKPNSFRMITLTSFQLKLLERMILWHLQNDTILNSNICSNQHGFRPGYSTESALHQLVWRIEQTIIDGQYAIGILLDIVGAFDNIGFDAIQKALTSNNIHPLIVRWIVFMIRNRTVSVELAGVHTQRDISKGCPQGGILSPFLWNLVFNSLLLLLKQEACYSQAYADDLIVLYRGFDLKTMHDLAQQTLNKISFWGKENGLSFSPEKSEVIVFTWNRKWVLDDLYLGDITIKRKECVKYLGCYLDSKLSWKTHVQEKARSATNALLTCKRVIGKNWGLNPKGALWIYTAIARPIIKYGCLIWINAINKITYISVLQKVQRLALIYVSGAISSTPTAALEILLSIPPLDIFLGGEAIKTMYRLEKNGTWSDRSGFGLKGKLRSHVDICLELSTDIPTISMPKDAITRTSIPEKYFTISIPGRDVIENIIDNIPVGSYECYTDGSKSNCTGSGAIIRTKNHGNDFSKYRLYLGSTSTVFQAEVIAIHMVANELLERNLTNENIFIFSDSQSAILALSNRDKFQRCVLECTLALNRLALTPNSVTITWVPGHSDIHGNELADTTAKEASQLAVSGPEPFYPLSYQSIKNDVRNWVKNKHVLAWHSRTDCKHTKMVLNLLDLEGKLLHLSRLILRQVIQVVTGHANLAKHLNTCGYVDSPTCPVCGEEDETPIHFLGKCPIFSFPRSEFFGLPIISFDQVLSYKGLSGLTGYLNYTRHLVS